MENEKYSLVFYTIDPTKADQQYQYFAASKNLSSDNNFKPEGIYDAVSENLYNSTYDDPATASKKRAATRSATEVIQVTNVRIAELRKQEKDEKDPVKLAQYRQEETELRAKAQAQFEQIASIAIVDPESRANAVKAWNFGLAMEEAGVGRNTFSLNVSPVSFIQNESGLPTGYMGDILSVTRASQAETLGVAHQTAQVNYLMLNDAGTKASVIYQIINRVNLSDDKIKVNDGLGNMSGQDILKYWQEQGYTGSGKGARVYQLAAIDQDIKKTQAMENGKPVEGVYEIRVGNENGGINGEVLSSFLDIDGISSPVMAESTLLGKGKIVSVEDAFHSSFYGFDQKHMNNTSETQIKEVVRRLMTNPSQTVLIVGHADAVQLIPGYNQTLSEQRAADLKKAIVEYAKKHNDGVDLSDRISTDGRGDLDAKHRKPEELVRTTQMDQLREEDRTSEFQFTEVKEKPGADSSFVFNISNEGVMSNMQFNGYGVLDRSGITTNSVLYVARPGGDTTSGEAPTAVTNVVYTDIDRNILGLAPAMRLLELRTAADQIVFKNGEVDLTNAKLRPDSTTNGALSPLTPPVQVKNANGEEVIVAGTRKRDNHGQIESISKTTDEALKVTVDGIQLANGRQKAAVVANTWIPENTDGSWKAAKNGQPQYEFPIYGGEISKLEISAILKYALGPKAEKIKAYEDIITAYNAKVDKINEQIKDEKQRLPHFQARIASLSDEQKAQILAMKEMPTQYYNQAPVVVDGKIALHSDALVSNLASIFV
ncbi:MAG: OmpA family protein, partial [Candidatus Omnitrophica bacterium]|nr:OmpA family protein [Candidatus Omnitrophota bacterium]